MEIKNFKIQRRGDKPEVELAKKIYEYVPLKEKNSKLYVFILMRIKNYGYSAALGKWASIKESSPKSYYKTFLSKDGQTKEKKVWRLH